METIDPNGAAEGGRQKPRRFLHAITLWAASAPQILDDVPDQWDKVAATQEV